ncbi:MAG: ABC transporter ATP-binding protein [Nitrosomonas sp.]|nr:ABC transporter ATP-binding protein [Nitrosomonas sp.]
MPQKQNVKYLARKMTACKHLLLLALLPLLVIAVILALLPFQFQHVLQAVYLKQDDSLAQKTMLTIMLLVIIYFFSSFVGQYWIRKTEYQLSLDIYNDLFNKLLYLPTWQYASLDKHLVMETTLSCTREVARATLHVITVLMRDALALFGLIVCLAYLNKEFVLLVCILIPFAFLIIPIITGQQSRKNGAWSQAIGNQTAKLADQLQYIFENFRHIRLFGGQQQEYRQLADMAQSIMKGNNQQDNYKAFVRSLCLLLLFLIIMAITYLMLQQMLEHALTLDQAGALLTAILLLITPLRRLSEVPRLLQQVRDSLKQLAILLDLPSTSIRDTEKQIQIRGKLVLEDINIFDQRKTPYLFNLTVEAGETIVLVADDNALRMLIIDVLLGFHSPATGKIKLDDHPYPEIEATALLAQFAVISRAPVILSDRVAGNIAYGCTECTHEASMTKIAQTTGVSEFVREMPEGLQTRVDKSGASLTAKQWQLIAIARALLKNAPLLIIDDLWPRQPADVSGDVFKTLKHTMRERTNILLLQAVPEYREGIDRIYIVKNGAVTALNQD